MHILATARLNLRTAEPGDAAFYLALVNDPDFVAQLGDRGIRTLADAHQALLDGPVAMQAQRGHSLYVAELKQQAVPIGMCGLIRRGGLDGVDLGYALLPAWRGQGYVHEAATALLAYAARLGFKRVLAITSPGNAASNRVLRRLGMRFERVIRLGPADADTNLYAIDINSSSNAGNTVR